MKKLATLIAAGLLATACGGGDDSSGSSTSDPTEGEVTGAVREVSEQGQPVTGGSVTMGLEAETDGWLPGESSFANAGVNVAYAIYDPLMKINADGEVHPYLAESMEANEDFTRWTLTLRPDIEFHDGTPLNAEALKTIFDDYLIAEGSNLLGSLGGVQMEVEDELTVTYVMPEPNSAFPYSLVLAAGWPFSPTAAAAAGDDAASQPVGTGPFVFESWERDSRLVVSRNEDYWQDGLPYLDEIVFRPIPDEDTRVSSLSTGDIDAMQSLRQSAIADVRALDGVDKYEQLGNNTGVNIFNTDEPPLDDIRVRRGLAYAIDQEQIIEVLGGTGIVPPATQLFSPDDPFYSEEVTEAWYPYDPEAAMEELQAYVDDPERSDGKSPGDPISVRLDCPPDPSLNELVQLEQALWTAVGVDVELRQVEQATHISEALSGDYQVKCFRAGQDGDPGIVLHNALDADSPTNFTGFHDPEIDQALQELRATDDLTERQALVEEISLIVNENVPITYSGQTMGVVAVRDYVKNIDGWTYPDGSPGGTSPQGTVQWSHVWTTE